MKDKIDFFPPGLALGKAFCNRVQERGMLKKAILKNEHLVMISPRRYGKTSLITQAIQENNIAYCSIDFLPATNSQYIKNIILDGVGDLLPQILPKQKVAMQKLLGFFKGLNPKFSVSVFKMGVSVELSGAQPAPKSIIEALMGLDQVAEELNKKVVVLLDEFQQISSLSDNHTIEASIRHAVERSKNVTYIFSGSDRHALELMFNDKNRPLFHLCKLVRIERIHHQDFSQFIQAAAGLHWKNPLPDEVIAKILELTECHTYYVNYLCRQLWDDEKCPDQLERVEEVWAQCVANQLPWITDDIGKLSANQRAVLAALVAQPTKEIFSQAFLEKTGLQISSIRRVIDSLQKSNMIQKNKEGIYSVLDPAITTYLRTLPHFS